MFSRAPCGIYTLNCVIKKPKRRGDGFSRIQGMRSCTCSPRSPARESRGTTYTSGLRLADRTSGHQACQLTIELPNFGTFVRRALFMTFLICSMTVDVQVVVQSSFVAVETNRNNDSFCRVKLCRLNMTNCISTHTKRIGPTSQRRMATCGR